MGCVPIVPIAARAALSMSKLGEDTLVACGGGGPGREESCVSWSKSYPSGTWEHFADLRSFSWLCFVNERKLGSSFKYSVLYLTRPNSWAKQVREIEMGQWI